MDNNLEGEINPIDPGEIVIDKTHLLARDKYSILKTEAYAMPSSTYVPDDSHTFFVSEDKTMCWANFGRCWNDEGDRILIAKQNSYKEWLLEFCPPDDYGKSGIIFTVNGVCHTTANRELLIGEFDLSVKDASKNFVTVAIFGKYGFGLDILKKLITDAFNRANENVMMTQDMLDTVLARVDNTLDDETEAWKQLIESYFTLQISDITSKHEDALEKLKDMIKTLLEGREKIYHDAITASVFIREEYEKQVYTLISTNVFNYFDFLLNNNYIDSQQNTMAKQSANKFFKALFNILDEQTQALQATGEMNQELAKKELFM